MARERRVRTSAGRETASQTVSRIKKARSSAGRSSGRSSGGSSRSSNQVGLNDTQISQLRGLSGIDQGALSSYVDSGSAVGGRNNPRGRGRENTITSDSVRDTRGLNLPTPTQGNDLTGLTNGINTSLAGAGDSTFDPATGFVSNAVDGAPSSSSDLFNSFLAENKSAQEDRPTSESFVREMQRELRPKENLVNSLQNQITAITSTRDANQLRLEGQGRGVTDTIIGGQQAKIGREAAIQALPLQAQLAAAQNDLDSARSYLNQLFTAKTQDATNEYNYRTQLNASVYSFLDGQEKRAMDANNRKLDREFGVEQANIAFQRTLGMQALEFGQNDLISGISNVDPASPTFEQDIAAFTGQLRKPVSGGGITAPKVTNIDGVDYVFNQETGQFEVPSITGATTKQTNQLIAAERTFEILNNIGNSTAIDSVVGPSLFSRGAGDKRGAAGRFLAGATAGGAVGAAAGSVVPVAGTALGGIAGALVGGTTALLQGTIDRQVTGEAQNLIGDMSQITAKLTNKELIDAKAAGATYGALGVKEQSLLENAATKINNAAVRQGGDPEGIVVGYNMSEENFKQEVDVIKFYTALDAAYRGASTETLAGMNVQQQADGQFYFRNYDGSFVQLNQEL